ncbi:phosphohistidine phosphatase SixA [Candidatus Sumerlaeota bacterium]|nr:phosphohistidine phosphatase SixA [Candidatus Sumerlaeota bacterium]
MRLYVVRHGIAVDRLSPSVTSDAERWLTEEGKTKTLAVAEGLEALGVKVDVILTSPLVRARQTAEILTEVLEPTGGLVETGALEPGFSMTELCEVLMAQGPPESAMIVGHEPDLSELISTLVWGDDRGEVEMKKAGCALLEIDALPPSEAGVTLRWLIPPKVLMRLIR